MHLSTSTSENRDGLFSASKTHILKLAGTRLKKCVAIAPRLLVDDDPKDIHDLRVSCRRLQQVIALLFPKPRRGKSRKVLRSLRDLRRDWNACRNLDVNLDLLQEKLESPNTDRARDAWDQVREYMSELRAQEFAGARKRLRRLDLFALIEKTRQLLEAVKIETVQELNFRDSLSDTRVQWHAALTRAKSSKEPKHLHELRISGKRLRYRFEILAELGDDAAKSHEKSLKALQDELGRWHDRHVLLDFVTELNEKPDFVSDHPEVQQMLERDMGAERQNTNAAIDGILKQAEMLQLDLAEYKGAVEPEDELTPQVQSSTASHAIT
jgi:CHAD domain-containing protein